MPRIRRAPRQPRWTIVASQAAPLVPRSVVYVTVSSGQCVALDRSTTLGEHRAPRPIEGTRMLTSAPIDGSVLAGVRARRRNSHFQLWLLRRPSAPPMHLPGRPAWLHWLGGELAADSGSVDVKARRQSDSTAEGAHDVQAFASAHRPFREEPATFNQRIGRHFDIEIGRAHV